MEMIKKDGVDAAKAAYTAMYNNGLRVDRASGRKYGAVSVTISGDKLQVQRKTVRGKAAAGTIRHVKSKLPPAVALENNKSVLLTAAPKAKEIASALSDG